MKKRVDIELIKIAVAYGGIDNYKEEIKSHSIESTLGWNSDFIAIGRILRGHLYVEYYLNKYLIEKYNLDKKELSSLTFYNKIKKIRKNDKLWIITGSIKKINSIRNKIAHQLSFSATENDRIFFTNINEFKSYWFIMKNTINENDFLDVYDLFCQFIAQRIIEALNPNQHYIDNYFEALRKDVVELWFGNEQVD